MQSSSANQLGGGRASGVPRPQPDPPGTAAFRSLLGEGCIGLAFDTYRSAPPACVRSCCATRPIPRRHRTSSHASMRRCASGLCYRWARRARLSRTLTSRTARASRAAACVITQTAPADAVLRTLLNSPDTWPPKKEALRAKGPSAVRRCSLQLQTPLYCHTGADPSYC
eukprot:scaffold40691_cov76-Phaeocystis_antarctica.AAC.1